MWKVTCGAAALALLLAGAPHVAAAAGAWGFDLAGADFAAAPGDDFFDHANGAWLRDAVIPKDRSAIGVDTALNITAEARIRAILEGGTDGVDPSARADADKIHAFYAAFMDEARAEALDDAPLAPLLARIRAATTHEEVAALMGVGRQSFFSSVFGVGIGADDKAPDAYAVSIRQGGLGLNRDYYLSPQLAAKKNAYLAYVAQMLALLGWEAPQQSAKAVVDFETAIAKVSWSNAERRDPEKTYNPVSVAALAGAAPFPWRRWLAAAGLSDVERVVTVENTALPMIAEVYARTPIDTLAAWQAFHLGDAAAPYLSARFVRANFDFHGAAMGGIAEQPERWRRAVTTVNGAMGQAIGRIYVARHFSGDAKVRIADLVANLRMALKGRIERLSWMSPPTRLKALDKLARLDVKLAYPDKWRDYTALEVRADDLLGDMQAARRFAWKRQVQRLGQPVDRDDWYMNPHTVNASYDSNLNQMVFPAGILQPPFFDPAADAAVNYGGIGAVIGHEMIHGFDDEGRKYDGSGVLTTWWTDEDAAKFTASTALLGRQFDAYEPLPGFHVKGDLTMGENIADLGGALVALDAYHRSLGEDRAPVRDGLSGDQRFFLGYAQSWRHKSTDDQIRQQTVSNPHAPERYRVNGIVRNMDAWYDAFGVQPGSRLFLAPVDRVRIW